MSENMASFSNPDVEESSLTLQDVMKDHNVEAQDLESHMVHKERKGRRTHLQQARSSTKTTTRVNRDFHKALVEKRGDFSLADPFDKSFLVVPPVVLDRFERAGYKVLFQTIGSDICNVMLRGGWVRVRLEEVPEFSAAGLPAMGSNNTLQSEYCTSLDQILLKISIEDFENKWQAWMDAQRSKSNSVIDRYLQNTERYMSGNFNSMSAMKLKSLSPD